MIEDIANHPMIVAAVAYGLSVLLFGALMLMGAVLTSRYTEPPVPEPWTLKRVAKRYKQCLEFVVLCCMWPVVLVLAVTNVTKKRGL